MVEADSLPLMMTLEDNGDDMIHDESGSEEDDFTIGSLRDIGDTLSVDLMGGAASDRPVLGRAAANSYAARNPLEAKLRARAASIAEATKEQPQVEAEAEVKERKTQKLRKKPAEVTGGEAAAKKKAKESTNGTVTASRNGEEGDGSDDDEVIGAAADRAVQVKSVADGRAGPMTEAEPTKFIELKLSMPLLKAIHDLGFKQSTPIQAAVIPVALKGVDLCASAVTGSGKTAAFLLPALERLLYRPRRIAATRVLVLCPTRELADQGLKMGRQLAKYTDVRFCLVVGGLASSVQEAELRSRPDVVVATPGRLIDLLRNAPSVGLDEVEILVLDEADRLLELGFKDEVNEVVKSCPINRQTMLFSATITEQVAELAGTSLQKPVQIKVDPVFNVAGGLTQEFVRIKQGKEHEREATLLSLATRVFRDRVIVFVKSKRHAHRLRLLFGLFGLRTAELHGNLTQQQRLQALEQFKLGEADFLIATDLAGRGLDISGVRTVINFELPADMKTYVHRVGRTARAGKQGKAISFVTEGDRAFLKRVLKHAASSVLTRAVAAESVAFWVERIAAAEPQITELLEEEKEEKEIRVAEMEANKAHNMIEHNAEIMSRPARSWFQSEKERAQVKDASRLNPTAAALEPVAKPTEPEAEKKPKVKRDKYAGMTRKKRRHLQRMEAWEKEAAAAGGGSDSGDGGGGGGGDGLGLPNQKLHARKAKLMERKSGPVLGKRTALAAAAAGGVAKKKRISAGGTATAVAEAPAKPQTKRAVAPPPRKVRSRSKPKFKRKR